MLQERLIVVCGESSDLYRLLKASSIPCVRVPNLEEAIAEAMPESGVLVLADDDPVPQLVLADEHLQEVASKRLRLFVEYPKAIAGLRIDEPRSASLERVVVCSEIFGSEVPKMGILSAHRCQYVPLQHQADELVDHLVLAQVAGYDRAIFGLPEEGVHTLLAEIRGFPVLVAATKISQFRTARYAPGESWLQVIRTILAFVQPSLDVPRFAVQPTVHPRHQAVECLPEGVEEVVLRTGTEWYFQSRLLLHTLDLPIYDTSAAQSDRFDHDRVGDAPDQGKPIGDGVHGILEGHASAIRPDGSQPIRWWRRYDCNGEAAGALALAGKALKEDRYSQTSHNLCEFLRNSILSGGDREDPDHPAFGLFGWNDVPLYHGQLDGYGVYYPDDNARGMLGTIIASAALDSDSWDERLLYGLLANLRLSGTNGVLPERIDQPDLIKRGWQYYQGANTVSLSAHYQAYIIAMFVWAFRHTNYEPFRVQAVKAMETLMDAYPQRWHSQNGLQLDRARMLLPLSWLVRLDATTQARQWLNTIARDLLQGQAECGAIQEDLDTRGTAQAAVPQSNSDYGQSETSLLQESGHPTSDLLYTTNFACFGLHEAAAATNDPTYRDAADRLTGFLCRCQTVSKEHPELHGAWYRAFDFGFWDYWASNADTGWGAWCTETGWMQSMILVVLALRKLKTSAWDLTEESGIGSHLTPALAKMSLC